MSNPFEYLRKEREEKARQEQMNKNAREEREYSEKKLYEHKRKLKKGGWKQYNSMVKSVLRPFLQAAYGGDYYIEDKKEWFNDSYWLGWKIGHMEKYEPRLDDYGANRHDYFSSVAGVYLLFDESNQPKGFHVCVGTSSAEIGLSREELVQTLHKLCSDQKRKYPGRS